MSTIGEVLLIAWLVFSIALLVSWVRVGFASSLKMRR